MWKVLYSVLKSCCKFLPQHPKTAIADFFWIKCKTAVVGGRIALKVLGHRGLISVFAWKGKKTQPSRCKWNLSKKNAESLLLCWAGPHTPCIFTDFGPWRPTAMHIYVRGMESKLRKAVWAVASDTQAAFTSVLAACLPVCSWVGSSGELLASCSSSSKVFFWGFFQMLEGAQQGTCVSASTQEDKNLQPPPAFNSSLPPKRLEAAGVEGTETALQCFRSPQQFCQGVLPQKPHRTAFHSHSPGPPLLPSRDDSWWALHPEFLILPSLLNRNQDKRKHLQYNASIQKPQETLAKDVQVLISQVFR